MTDRISALIVALSRDAREEDVERLCAVIRHLRGVAGVTTRVVEISDYVARMRADKEWHTKIIALLKPRAEMP